MSYCPQRKIHKVSHQTYHNTSFNGSILLCQIVNSSNPFFVVESIFPAGFTIKDPSVWLDGARPALIRSYYEFGVVVIRQTGNVHTLYE